MTGDWCIGDIQTRPRTGLFPLLSAPVCLRDGQACVSSAACLLLDTWRASPRGSWTAAKLCSLSASVAAMAWRGAGEVLCMERIRRIELQDRHSSPHVAAPRFGQGSDRSIIGYKRYIADIYIQEI